MDIFPSTGNIIVKSVMILNQGTLTEMDCEENDSLLKWAGKSNKKTRKVTI